MTGLPSLNIVDTRPGQTVATPTSSEVSLNDIIATLERHHKYLNDDQLSRLAALTASDTEDEEPSALKKGDTIFDHLSTEVDAQLLFLRGVREKAMRGEEPLNVRQVKDLMQTTTSLFKMLGEVTGELKNQNRLRKIELATVDAIKTLPQDIQVKFFTELERRMTELHHD